MSRPKILPFCPGVSPAEVASAAAEVVPHKLARTYNVRTELMHDWLTGRQAMPAMLYELLAFRRRCVLPSTAGNFAGWEILDGQRFTGPGLMHKGGITFEDVFNMPDYWRAQGLVERQCDLIERLTKERDFYRRQCELETRHGVLLRMLIDGPQRRGPSGALAGR